MFASVYAGGGGGRRRGNGYDYDNGDYYDGCWYEMSALIRVKESLQGVITSSSGGCSSGYPSYGVIRARDTTHHDDIISKFKQKLRTQMIRGILVVLVVAPVLIRFGYLKYNNQPKKPKTKPPTSFLDHLLYGTTDDDMPDNADYDDYFPTVPLLDGVPCPEDETLVLAKDVVQYESPDPNVLPLSTIETINRNSSCPQAQAWKLIQRHPAWQTMPLWRKRQRMAMATFYLTTRSWKDAQYDCPTDECIIVPYFSSKNNVYREKLLQ